MSAFVHIIVHIHIKNQKLSRKNNTFIISVPPYKGDASYYSIIAGGERSKNAVWTYDAPNAAVSNIKDHLAFYPDRVDGIEEMASPEAGTF